jgi:hypothetical protein
MPVNFITAVFDDGDGPMWAVLPDDLTDGFVIGEWDEVLCVHQALTRLVETHQADEEVTDHDERLGVPWLSVSDAAGRYDVPADTVRYAARNGHISNAEKQGKLWRFPQRNFLYWLNHVYQPRKELFERI